MNNIQTTPKELARPPVDPNRLAASIREAFDFFSRERDKA
jgi:hypothetical protein